MTHIKNSHQKNRARCPVLRHINPSIEASSPILPLESALMRRCLICIHWCLTRIVWALPVIPRPRGAVGACVPADLFCWVIRPPQRSPATCAMMHELHAHFTRAHPANAIALKCHGHRSTAWRQLHDLTTPDTLGADKVSKQSNDCLCKTSDSTAL